MAYSIETRSNNPANRLRDELDIIERQIVTLHATDGEAFLLRLDRIDQMFDELNQASVDLRSEQGRWQGVLSRLNSKPSPIVRTIGARRFAKLRQQHQPATGQWWHLDQVVRARTRQAITRFATTAATIIGVIALILWTMNTFFPPDPTTVAMVEISSNVDRYLIDQDWESALAEVEEAIVRFPDEPELLMRRSVLAQQLGDDEGVAESLAQAEELVPGKPALFWTQMGTYYLQVTDFENARLAGEKSLEYNPDEAQAYFLLAGISEAEGNSRQAIDFFEKTFELAEDDNPQLAVIAKVRMGYLMQSISPFPDSTSSEEGND